MSQGSIFSCCLHHIPCLAEAVWGFEHLPRGNKDLPLLRSTGGLVCFIGTNSLSPLSPPFTNHPLCTQVPTHALSLTHTHTRMDRHTPLGVYTCLLSLSLSRLYMHKHMHTHTHTHRLTPSPILFCCKGSSVCSRKQSPRSPQTCRCSLPLLLGGLLHFLAPPNLKLPGGSLSPSHSASCHSAF